MSFLHVLITAGYNSQVFENTILLALRFKNTQENQLFAAGIGVCRECIGLSNLAVVWRWKILPRGFCGSKSAKAESYGARGKKLARVPSGTDQGLIGIRMQIVFRDHDLWLSLGLSVLRRRDPGKRLLFLILIFS